MAVFEKKNIKCVTCNADITGCSGTIKSRQQCKQCLDNIVPLVEGETIPEIFVSFLKGFTKKIATPLVEKICELDSQLKERKENEIK